MDGENSRLGSADPVDLAPLSALLADNGIAMSLTQVDYQFQRGESAMLVCQHLDWKP